MEILQIAGLAILVCLAALLLRPVQPAFGALVALAACTGIFVWLVQQFAPVAAWLRQVAETLDGESFGILLRCTGIALIAQLGQAFCRDSGQEALGAAVELSGRAMVLLAALPFLRTILTAILQWMA